MTGASLPVPGIVFGSYPERRPAARDSLTTGIAVIRATFAGVFAPSLRAYRQFAADVERQAEMTASLLPQELVQRVISLRAELRRHGLVDSLLVQSFALINETCFRQLHLRPYATQIMAARIMLDGDLAEMATGEGKTLALALAASSAALAGIPVHVLTANDYLVARDAEFLRPLAAALGLTVGAVTQDLPVATRRLAYGCDITYCTAKEIAFDYLRDGLQGGHARSELERRVSRLAQHSSGSPAPLLRGLCLALIDEVDGILIDESRVPLVIAQATRNEGERDYRSEALSVARSLTASEHFQLDAVRRIAELTEAGSEKIAQLTAALPSVWRNRLHREETAALALAALYLFHRDAHYVVRGGKVLIIDETTSRAAPGRMWSRGLHQLIELKEGCRPTPDQQTAARITYQRLFARYLRLGGMSGTLAESRIELASMCGLKIVPVPLRLPSLRQALSTRVFSSSEQQWLHVVQRVRELHEHGRPVLIGTDSVADSEKLAAHLTAANLPHSVLNARQNAAEAQIVECAGQRNAITVATNMAGRGTDIVLGEGVIERGGLHVICCQHNPARRIDRQFRGRCARRGEPGSVETVLSLESPLIAAVLPRWLARHWARSHEVRPRWLAVSVAAFAQRLEESRQRAQRRQLLKQDTLLNRRLSFGSRAE